jgi:hypothetical protein
LVLPENTSDSSAKYTSSNSCENMGGLRSQEQTALRLNNT